MRKSGLMQDGATVGVIDVGDLPQRASSAIKNDWGAVARQTKQVGRVAITNRRQVDMVIMSVDEYTALMEKVRAAENEKTATLDRLTARFEQSLAVLQAPDSRDRLSAAFLARGQMAHPPVVGETY